MSSDEVKSKPAEGVPYWTPAQEPPIATPKDLDSAPTLYKPLKVRGVETHNRWVAAPMCTYSAHDGHLSDWHTVHLGSFAMGGAGLVIVEATAVEPRGRITPQCSGLWQDSQIAPLKRVVDFLHSQNTKAGIQLVHAGRKASMLVPWVGGTANKTLAGPEAGGWPENIVGPSPVPFSEDLAKPHELTVDEIKGMVQAFAESAKRAVQAGIDVIEIHGAHGFLTTSFLSPLSNKRTDHYGGSFENRTRFLFEIIHATRAVIPESMPLWLRVSATEWAEHLGEPSWTLDDTIRLAKLLPAVGVDVLDISSGGNTPQQKITVTQTYQTDLAGKVRAAVQAEGLDLRIGAVGFISSGEIARRVVEEDADYALVARQFLRDPHFPINVAKELGLAIQWPHQYHRMGENWRKSS